MQNQRTIYFTQSQARLTASCLVKALDKGMAADYWALNAPAASAASKLMAKGTCRDFTVRLEGSEIVSIRNALKAFAPGDYKDALAFEESLADIFEHEEQKALDAFAFEMAGYTAPLRR